METEINRKMERISYNYFAEDYHQKRKKPWKALKDFLNRLNNEVYQLSGNCLDLGCANGRNFKLLYSKNRKLIGIDNSIHFLKIAQEQLNDTNLYSNIEKNSIQLILSDMLFLPIRPNTINNIYSIAAIHHIKKLSEQKRLMNQIHEILKDQGYFLFSVWRKYQRNYIKYFIIDWIKRSISKSYHNRQKEIGLENFGDIFIPWKVAKDNETYYRFYHLFSKLEIKKMLKQYRIKEVKKLGGPNKKDNFFVLAKKLES
ncbi:MAG: class I SAM-dependent methyltransferase [Candidatus Hodarchaeota archaeon]